MLGLSGTFSCYFVSATGNFYTEFMPDMSTAQLASSANPAYAQCIVSNYLTSEDFDYVLLFNVSGDWASCLTGLATPSPTPSTFAPTTALQGELTLGVFLGPPRGA